MFHTAKEFFLGNTVTVLFRFDLVDGNELSIHRLFAVLVEDCLPIDSIGSVFRTTGHNFKYIDVVCVQDLLIHFIDVQIVFCGTHGDVQRLMNDRCIDLVVAEIGTITQNRGVCLLQSGIKIVLLYKSVQRRLNVAGIQTQIRNQVDRIGRTLCIGAGTAIIISSFHNGIHIQTDACILGSQRQLFIQNPNGHIQTAVCVVSGFMQIFLSLLLGQTTQIYTGCKDLFVDQSIILRLSEQHKGNTHDDGNQKNGGYHDQGDHGDTLLFLLSCRGTAKLCCIRGTAGRRCGPIDTGGIDIDPLGSIGYFFVLNRMAGFIIRIHNDYQPLLSFSGKPHKFSQ